MDKYRQVEEFLRLLKPTLDNEVGAQSEISIVDLGCGQLVAKAYYCVLVSRDKNLLGAIDSSDFNLLLIVR